MSIGNAAKALTGLWDPSWEGALMASLTYTVGESGNGPYQTEIQQSGRRVLRLKAVSGAKESLVMMLVLPPHRQREEVQDVEFPVESFLWKRFSKEEISSAALRVDDHNGIHQGTRPIAGGFFLMESIVHTFPGHRRYRLRFEAPVYAGDAVYLEPLSCGVTAYAGHHLVFRADWED